MIVRPPPHQKKISSKVKFRENIIEFSPYTISVVSILKYTFKQGIVEILLRSSSQYIFEEKKSQGIQRYFFFIGRISVVEESKS